MSEPATPPYRELSISVGRSWEDVYRYVHQPRNFAHWAAGLGDQYHQENDEWCAVAPDGQTIRIRFTPRNEYGIVDHTVRVGDLTVLNPMRVLPNGTGAVITFFLSRRVDMSDQEFAADAAAVERDLEKLKSILERSVVSL